MKTQWSIRWRLQLWTISFAALVILATVGQGFFSARDMAIKETRERALFLAESAAALLDGKLFQMTSTVGGLADALSAGDLQLSFTQVLALQERILQSHPGIFGVTIALAPDIPLPSKWPGPAPYSFRKEEGGIGFTDIGDDYLQRDWYQFVEEKLEPVWTAPYWWGDILMVTYSHPLWRMEEDNRIFAGVVTCDLTLDWLDETLEEFPLGVNGYALLMDTTGLYVVHPMRELVLNKTIFEVAADRGTSDLAERGRRMISKQRGVEEHTAFLTEARGWLAYLPLRSADWIFAAAVSHDNLERQIAALARRQLLLGFAGLTVLAGALMLIARTITRPIEKLCEVSRELAAGNLAVALPARPGGDEVTELARVLDTMRLEIARRMAELAEATALRTRMESELLIARTIQMDLVPKTFPPLPDRPELELFATLLPAREVGGDYYDFFPIEGDRLVVLIADVADKGVPAALYMAATRSLIRAHFHTKPAPDAAMVLHQLNVELAMDNPKCMFVTVFCGVLELNTRRLVFSNAGHSQPLLLGRNGKVEWVSEARGPVAGAWPEAHYTVGERFLQEGEFLLLYTDGITEAENGRQQFFGEEALTQVTRQSVAEGKNCQELVETVLRATESFADGAPASDDRTLLALRLHARNPAAPTLVAAPQALWQSEFTKHQQPLRESLDALEKALSEAGVAEALIYDARLVLEELGTNAITAWQQPRATQGEGGAGRIRVEFWAESPARMVFEDDGAPFDPITEAPRYDPAAPLPERPAGGAGLHLLHALTKEMRYVRAEGWNLTTIVFVEMPKN